MVEKRPKKIDKETATKWYNLVKKIVNNNYLVPEREEEEIYKLVSRENWIIFALEGMDKEDTINSENPNVYLDIISRKGDKDEATLGLTFNNLKAYEKFKTIMKSYNHEIKNKITADLLGLKNDWKINIKRKVKNFNHAQTPNYLEVKSWNSNQLNDKIIDELIEMGNHIKEEGLIIREEKKKEGKFYRETPSINLMESTFKLNEEEIGERIPEIFEVLALCLNVKTQTEENRSIKQRNKILSETEILRKRKLLYEEGLSDEDEEDYLHICNILNNAEKK